MSETCFDCKKRAPKTATRYTLVGAKHGWRLTRHTEGGEPVIALRCPDCWRAYKASRDAAPKRRAR